MLCLTIFPSDSHGIALRLCFWRGGGASPLSHAGVLTRSWAHVGVSKKADVVSAAM